LRRKILLPLNLNLMKSFACFLLIGTTLLTSPLPSGVVNWSDVKPSKGSREFFKGSTDVFESFEVTGETLPAGSKATPYALKGDEELVIVKEGKLTATIGGTTQTLGPGSIAYVMTGETRSYTNTEKTEASFYRLRFHAAKPDNSRGAEGGGSFTRDWNEIEKKTTDKGFRREFFDRPTAMSTKFEMHVTTLKAGLSSHAPHTHPEEEIILMLRGKAEMEIDGKRHPVTPGTLSYVSTKIPHALHNTGDGEAEYFAFQWK
jgi:(S)-ureidoglycine aminohydrolase